MTWLLNPRTWLYLALAGALALSHFFAYRTGEAVVRADFDAFKVKIADERTRAAQAAQAAEAAARKEEQRRAVAARKVIDEAKTQAAAARADADAAGLAADGLRGRVAALVAASRPAARDPAAAGGGQGIAGADPLDLFSELLARSDGVSGELAAYADRLRIAGAACERHADAIAGATAEAMNAPR